MMNLLHWAAHQEENAEGYKELLAKVVRKVLASRHLLLEAPAKVQMLWEVTGLPCNMDARVYRFLPSYATSNFWELYASSCKPCELAIGLVVQGHPGLDLKPNSQRRFTPCTSS